MSGRNKMRLLITGIHGFVGSNLVNAFADKYEIYGLDIVAPFREGVVKTFSWKDLDAGSIPEVDAIIHLAGKAHDTKNRTQSASYFQVNTGLTRKIFDYFSNGKAQRFIFFSSVKAAAERVVDPPLTEEVVPAPQGPYGESKIAAERYILDRMRESSDEFSDKYVYILRPSMIHGPGNKGNLNLLYQVVKKGFPWPLGAYENRRSFTSIENLTFVVSGLLTGKAPSGIYHMADDETVSTNELITLICRSLNKKSRIWKLDKTVIAGCAAAGTFLHLPLDRERLRKLTEDYVVSNEKIKQALGIERLPVRAVEGLKQTFDCFR